MDTTIEQWNIPEGTEVIAADGDKVGKVIETQADYLVVEKGFFFPTDYAIPTRVVSNYDGDKVYLAVTKDEALHQTWDTAPAASAEADRVVTPTPVSAPDTVRGGTDEALRVPVHEEELTATKRPVELGQVRIDKDVVAEERTLDVPITQERVTVQRRVVDRDAPPDAPAFREETIEVPIRSEQVDVHKRPRVAEEIVVGKETVQRTERVADTVRREQVNVDDTGAPGRASTTATQWASAAADYAMLTGKDVYSADGEKVGTVKAVYGPGGTVASSRGQYYILLDPGLVKDWFGGLDEVYLPASAIGGVNDKRVDLTLTNDQLKAESWMKPADAAGFQRL